MLKRFCTVIIITMLHINIFAFSGSDNPVRIYQMGDWVSYKNCNYVTSLTESDEFIYFGTGGGIVPYQRYRKLWMEPYTVSDGLSDDFITAVYYDYSTGYLWASHRNGISFLNPAEESWENTSDKFPDIHQQSTIVRLGSVNTSVCAFVTSGQIREIDSHFGNYLGYIEENQTGEIIWEPSGLDPVPSVVNFSINPPYLIDGRGIVVDPYFREYKVNLFYKDNRLDIYGGIRDLGILTGDYNVKILNVQSFGPLQNYISAMCLDDDELFAGSFGKNDTPKRKGISVLNLNSGKWTYFENPFIPELASANVNDIYKDDAGRVWVATDLGLSVYNNKTNRWKRYSVHQGLNDENISTIAIDDTLAWIGTPIGLNKIFIPTMKIKRVYLSHDKRFMKIYKIAVSRNCVWVGTDNGLYSIDKLTHNVEHYDMNGKTVDIDAAIMNNVKGIAVSDSLVVFSQYDGLLTFNHINNNFKRIPQYIDSHVLDMDMNRKYLWLGTDNGAYLIRLRDYYTEQYRLQDGLAGLRVNRVRIGPDFVWFGTDRGITKYNWRKYAY
ncbi:MAG: hypothetical protein DRP96_04865 [Candidatus Neomarinimicrobiota bacterium]|nr:MAG: hypothetical protein DRP96_04865 [Candidatus Neomarinimicrobiota bacterium]